MPIAAAGLAAVASSDRTACCKAAAPTNGFVCEHPPTVLQRQAEWPLRCGDPVPITLEYFCLRALGELPRLLLEVCDVPYDTVYHYLGGYFKPYSPFGSLPVYREGDLLLTQSSAICRHIADKFGIAGSTCDERGKVDMWFELAKDIKSKKAAVYDMEKHADAAKLRQFLVPAEATCDGKYFVGASLTLADVAMFEALQAMVECNSDCLKGYPTLNTFVANFAARPQIAAYLASPRRLPLTANEDGKAPHSGMAGYTFKEPLDPRVYAVEWQVPGTPK